MIDFAYDNAPAVLVFSDSVAGGEACVASAIGTGGRVQGTVDVVDAARRLDEQPSVEAVLADITHDGGDALDRMLDRLDQAARAGRHASVVSLTADLIDIAAARAPHPNVLLLCTPDPADRMIAAGFALSARAASSVRDQGDEPRMQLRQISEEVGRIARSLAAMASMDRIEDRLRPGFRDRDAPVELTAASIRNVLRARRLRDQYFDTELFADPAWDMLLDLMAARLEQRQVAVSSLCIAAAVPPTTALRWIKTLTDEGLFVRVADPHDGRRVFIALCDAAAEAMTAYFQQVERLGVGFP